MEPDLTHDGDLAQSFHRFIHLYTYKYQASDRKPTSTSTSTEDVEAWVAKEKWMQFMGNYATDHLLDDIAAVQTNPEGQKFDAGMICSNS